MRVVVKKLQGEDITVEVESSTPISHLKKEVTKQLGIPPGNQKLLLLGKTLSDTSTIGSYPKIKEGTKINLVVKKQEGAVEVAQKILRKRYREPQATNKANNLLKILKTKVSLMSLDDLERLALNCLEDRDHGITQRRQRLV